MQDLIILHLRSWSKFPQCNSPTKKCSGYSPKEVCKIFLFYSFIHSSQFSVISKQIYGCLFVMDIRDDDILGTCVCLWCLCVQIWLKRVIFYAKCTDQIQRVKNNRGTVSWSDRKWLLSVQQQAERLLQWNLMSSWTLRPLQSDENPDFLQCSASDSTDLALGFSGDIESLMLSHSVSGSGWTQCSALALTRETCFSFPGVSGGGGRRWRQRSLDVCQQAHQMLRQRAAVLISEQLTGLDFTLRFGVKLRRNIEHFVFLFIVWKCPTEQWSPQTPQICSAECLRSYTVVIYEGSVSAVTQ